MHLSPYASVRSKAVVLLLLIYCLMCFPLFVGVLCLSLFGYALLCVLSSFAINLKRKRELVALLLMSYGCLVAYILCYVFSRCRGLVCSLCCGISWSCSLTIFWHIRRFAWALAVSWCNKYRHLMYLLTYIVDSKIDENRCKQKYKLIQEMGTF